MSDPKKHHFFAQFHLSAWAELDGRIPTYQRIQDGTIKLIRFLPEETGFERHLYAMEDVPADQRQRYEKEFFSKYVDQQAAQVYQKIVESDPRELTTEERMIWTRYLMAQQARVPDMVKHIREITKNGIRDLMMERNATYLALRKESGNDELPDTALEWFDQKYPGRRANLALDILTRAIQSPKISDQLFRMHWWVYDASMSLVPVLASDRPMQISSSVFKADCIVSLPLTPSKIFLAAPYGRQ